MVKVVHAVDGEIEGHLDPSLAKAIGLTDTQFKRLESASNLRLSTRSWRKRCPRGPVRWIRSPGTPGKLSRRSAKWAKQPGETFMRSARTRLRIGLTNGKSIRATSTLGNRQPAEPRSQPQLERWLPWNFIHHDAAGVEQPPVSSQARTS
jgi:hypothetical protein